MKKKRPNPAAQALGRLSARSLTKAQLSDQRRAAVQSRWAKYRARKAAQQAETGSAVGGDNAERS